MAKPKLTKVAIRFIVQTYEDESNNYTFEQIRELLEDEYQIDISYEAVRKSYHKHKNDPSVTGLKVKKTKEEGVISGLNNQQNVEPKRNIRTIIQDRGNVKSRLTNKDRGYDTSLEDDVDIDALFTTQNKTDK